MQSYQDLMSTKQYGESMEMRKVPGQKFCDNYGWNLNEKFITLQRPDKITFFGGAIYRTHTPVYHIWYKSKLNPNLHIWLEFSGDTIIVKYGIKTTSDGRLIEPDPDICQAIYYFNDTFNETAGSKVVKFLNNK